MRFTRREKWDMGLWTWTFHTEMLNLQHTVVYVIKSGYFMTSLYWKWSENHLVMSNSLWPHGLYSPWNSPGQNAGVGSLSLLQGIFPTQGSNPGLPHCRQTLHQLSHKGSPGILERVSVLLPVDLLDPGIELGSPALQADSLPTELSGKPTD